MKPPALCNHLVQCILQAVHRRTTKECFEQRRAAREPTELGRTGLRVPLALQEKLGLYDSGTSSFSGSLPRLSLGQYLFVSLKRQQHACIECSTLYYDLSLKARLVSMARVFGQNKCHSCVLGKLLLSFCGLMNGGWGTKSFSCQTQL